MKHNTSTLAHVIRAYPDQQPLQRSLLSIHHHRVCAPGTSSATLPLAAEEQGNSMPTKGGERWTRRGRQR